MAHRIKIKSVEPLTHDVLRIVTEKPSGYTYLPGQAADLSISTPEWENELRAFTFTSLPEEDLLEFTVKIYPSHHGVTSRLRSMDPGSELNIFDPFGDIRYKGEGIFIAGGAGITPFIAIFRDLEKQNQIGNNKIIFANKTKSDIILEEKFKSLLGKNFISILSGEKHPDYTHGYITADLIRKNSDENLKYYYLCGPEPMMQSVEGHLSSLGISEEYIVKENF